ncbi:MAG TPA: hypothetical protein VGE68_11445 [Sphingomicrobium sp.]
MSKRVCAIAGIVLLSTPGMGTAKDRLEPRVQAMLACEAIAANDARLQCFDQALAALKQGMAAGSVVVEEKKAPVALGGVIKASGTSGDDRFWVEFENGDRWALVTEKGRRGPPPAGSTLKLKKTFFGNYWASGPKWSESEADFLGHKAQ